MKAETDGNGSEGHISDDAREPAMGATGASLTVWAACRAASKGHLHDELLLVLVEANRIEPQASPVGKDGRKEGSQAHEGDSDEQG
jgi:hypothetical protein